jgi:hypothetical protein
MGKSAQKKNKVSARLIAAAIFAAAVVIAAGLAVSDVEGTAKEQGGQLLEKSLYRAAVSCYSVEGMYPPTLEYLAENYGGVIDSENYAVFYEIFADNIMPNITVVALS